MADGLISDAYDELIGPFKAAAATDVFNMATNFMQRCERIGSSIITDRDENVLSYLPSVQAETLADVFEIAHDSIPDFIASQPPQNLEAILDEPRRERLLKAMLELKAESRVRSLVVPS